MTSRIGLVGLGIVSQTYLDVFHRLSGLEVIAGVDTAPNCHLAFRGRSLPVYRFVNDMLNRHELDDVIVATPTPTHVQVCRELLRSERKPRILVEKPLATQMEDVQQLLDEANRRNQGLDVLYHFRYSPEVVWAVNQWDEFLDLYGPIVEFSSFFSDPYAHIGMERRATYVSSWTDSGINALSLLDRFLTLEGVLAPHVLPDLISTVEASVSFVSRKARGVGHLMTSWQVVEGSRWTRLRFANDFEVLLDHSAVFARLSMQNKTVGLYASSADVPRRTAHYLNLFGEVFSPTYTPNASRTLLLHRLLLADDRQQSPER
jgi:predicted dehydrogenase